MSIDHSQGKQIQSTVRADGTLKLSIETVPTPIPGDEEVIVQIGASPLNPSDLGVLFGGADISTARVENGSVVADIPEAAMRAMSARMDKPLPVGNEGAGVVVEAGDSELAQSLLGKTVAILGGAMYSQYRCIKAKQCLLLPDGTTPAEAASCFVNPLTSLGMVETMRLEGHKALVHTAAASNLGQMLQKICNADGVDLVTIVRKPEQVEILQAIGAKYVCDSSAPSFMDDLVKALVETGATIAFDATGGGTLASRILTAMEIAQSKTATEFSPYGSTTHKQVYIYGGLDRSATELTRGYGMAWGVGGWLLPPFLQRIGFDAAQKLRARVAAEIKTTFASNYAKEVSLDEALSLSEIAVYGKQATGEKYLINPNK
ncbi:MAG: zinc-binding dehydrogenase [Woeseiaceae bacterium]